MSDYENRLPRIGLWINKRGPYASGNCGNIRFVLWENTRKQGGRSPDLYLVLEAAQRRDDKQRETHDFQAPLPDDEIGF